MSFALIEDLSAASTQLRAAMQRADLPDIESSMERFRSSLAAVQAVGAWRANPEAKAKIKALAEELESSRALACLLGDMTGQMNSAMAARNLDAPQTLYGPGR
jgi:Spy/CpxP family protein refolding chaperone